MPDESTTPDLEEVLQRLIDAGNAGDIDAAMNLFASDIVWEGRFETFEGRGALRGLLQDWLGAYDELELAGEEIRDLGNGVTFYVLIQRGRPRGSAGWVQHRQGVVTTWVDGLVRRVTFYPDIDEARAAAERLAEELGQMVSGESTPPDLVERWQRFRDALNCGNLDAVVAFYAPDAVWDVQLLGLEGVFEGREAIRGALDDLIAPYDDLEIVAEESRDLGSGVALNVFLARGRLRGSTRFVESRMASASTWANGLIERLTSYPDIEQARAAADRLAEELG